MSKFEFLSVLISIVIALGVSELTFSWGRLIQNRRFVRFSLLHAFWSVFVLFLMIQFWWGFWNFRVVESWSFAALLGVVFETVLLVVCALLLTPYGPRAKFLDLEALYFEQARPFFIIGAVLLLQFSIIDAAVAGMPLFHPENYVRTFGAVVATTLAWSLNRNVHRGMTVICAALLGVFLLFSRMV